MRTRQNLPDAVFGGKPDYDKSIALIKRFAPKAVPARRRSVRPRKTKPMRRLGANTGADHPPRKFRSIEFYNRLGILVSGLLIFLIGGWSAVALINGAVVSPATLIVEGGTQSIQHLEGGIVRQIHVREGQFVTRGAVLVELDTTKSRSRESYLSAQVASLNSQIVLIDEQLAGLNELFRKGLSRKSEILVTRRRRVALDGQRKESQAQLKSVHDEIARATVKAPISGFVHQLKAQTLGGVVQPGETFLQIIPSGSPLSVEARIDPRSIDQVGVGQLAIVRFTSFDQRTTPELKGAVSLVAADRSRDHANALPYYKVRIRIAADQFKHLGDKKLKPGMPAEVFVLTRPRSALSYFIKPISDQLSRALRE